MAFELHALARLTSSDGVERHVEQQTEVAEREGGRALIVTATVRDVTERKNAEEKIRCRSHDSTQQRLCHSHLLTGR
ncbi:MAG: PAS domain S-box protein [Acidobacteria bacterium]|nr:PAS domain S-box protein [Acidobacteriota bacterium]